MSSGSSAKDARGAWVSRTSLVVGERFGGALIASVQGVLMICIAGLAGASPHNPVLMITVLAELFLLALTLVSFGMVVAARIKQFQSFMAVTQMLVMPLFFLSGALYPLSGLPTWLKLLTRVDPLTHAVDPLRKACSFEHLPQGAQRAVVKEARAGGHLGRVARPGRRRSSGWSR